MTTVALARVRAPGPVPVGLVDRRSIADSVPSFLPAIPFGFVLGLAITEGAMPMAIGWSTSLFVRPPAALAGVAAGAYAAYRIEAADRAVAA